MFGRFKKNFTELLNFRVARLPHFDEKLFLVFNQLKLFLEHWKMRMNYGKSGHPNKAHKQRDIHTII